MLLFLCSIVFATAAGVTAFLICVSGDFKKFRESFKMAKQEPKKYLPVITRDGQIIDTKQELEAQLEVLQYNLEKKKSELDSSKSRIFAAANSLKKLSSTSTEVKKYYLRLTGEAQKHERDFQLLQQEIDDYRKRKLELETSTISDENFEDALNLSSCILSFTNSAHNKSN